VNSSKIKLFNVLISNMSSALQNTPWHYVDYLHINAEDQTVGLQFDGNRFHLPRSLQEVSRNRNLIHISANHAVVLAVGPLTSRDHFAPTYEVSVVMFKAMLVSENYLSAHSKQVISEAMLSPMYRQMGFPEPFVGISIGAELAIERSMRNTGMLIAAPLSQAQPDQVQPATAGMKRGAENDETWECFRVLKRSACDAQCGA
jgi:hypothetical protein